MIPYSSNRINIYDDEILQPLAEWHPCISNDVYNGMDRQCPSYQYKLYKQVKDDYGEITSITKVGDLHVAVYDPTDNQLNV